MRTVRDHARLSAARTPGHAAGDERGLARGQPVAEAVAVGPADAGVAPDRRAAAMPPNPWERASAETNPGSP